MPKHIKILLILCLFFACAIIYLVWASSQVILSGYLDQSCRKPFHMGRMDSAIPNCEGVRNAGEGPIPIEFNSRGYRDSEHPMAPSPGVFRIAFLGASIHVSPGLRKENSLGRILEKELATQGLEKVEVMNFSVEGFTTISHLQLFREYLRYHPQLILLATVDGYKPFRDLWLGDFLKSASKDEVRFISLQEVLGSRWQWLLRWPAVARLFHHVVQVERQFHHTRVLAAFPAGSAGQAAYLLSRTLPVMALMREMARDAGADFQFVWTGEPLSNQVALRINDSPALAYIYGPMLPRIRIEPQTALAAFTSSGELPLDIAKEYPPKEERANFIGSSYYFNGAGMKKYGSALAHSLAPMIRKARADHP